MSSNTRWDQPDGEGAAKVEDGVKTAADAAAAAAAIAAKIAAQFAGTAGNMGEFSENIDINDVRNRYMLTKGTTQQEISEATGAFVSTKGVWYPDRSRATEKDPPLYLQILAPSQAILTKAIDKVNELIALDLGSLVEDKKDRLKRKWPEEKLFVGLESIRNFNVRAKVVGPSGSFVKYIQQETGTRVQIKGLGSGFVEQETGRESEEPLYIHITGPEEPQVARAKVLTEDLLLVVRSEHAKMGTLLQQQQLELHQAQAQYAAYSGVMVGGGYAPQPGGPPPPPPADGQPPPPDGSAASQQDAYAQYWAAYGYDVNSEEFKQWAATQQQQSYGQQYPQGQGYDATSAAAPPPDSAPPPPPPPS